MKITSWNVNGIRAVERKGLLYPMLSEIRPDVLVLQETKAHPDQLPDTLRHIPSYHAFFDNHKSKGGYSGVALYTKQEPKKVAYGMGMPDFDQEGRLITAFYENMTIIGGYFPNGGQGPERLAYKMAFYDAFLAYADDLQKTNPVVWGGDVNTAHTAKDLARPKENEQNTGFLPMERAWLDKVVSHGWVDSFRALHPEEAGAYTYWDMKTRARERNVGWRIDYLFLSPSLLPSLKSATIEKDILGSDHCPISVDIAL
jgi:exodeoxyribonuclease-3